MARWCVLSTMALVLALSATAQEAGEDVHGHVENGNEVVHDHSNTGAHDHVHRGQKTLITDTQPKGEVVGHRIIHPENPELCPLGCKGDPGNKGARGPRGRAGQRGHEGEPGAPGYGGWAGWPATEYATARARAVKGDVGPPGNAGPDGMAGNDGENGGPGPEGPSGNPGPRGDAGGPGEPGLQGNDGRRGPPGNQGTRGEAGPNGSDGSNGRKGAKGNRGNAGVDGSKGALGLDGIPGRDGGIGAKGVRGSRGPRGARGLKGFMGAVGIDGDKGMQGDTGAKGPVGDAGDPGFSGIAGAQGVTGETGEQGIRGEYGPYIEKITVNNAGTCTEANAGKTLYDPETKKLFFCSNGMWQCVKDEACNQDCMVGPWDDFGQCSTTCGEGVMRRSRKVSISAGPLGAACPALHEERPCNMRTCFCEDPGSIEHGFRGADSGNAIGGTVEWICTQGFFLIGPKMSVCSLQPGDTVPTFSDKPFCSERSCPRIINIENGSVRPSVNRPTSQRVLTFSCNAGFMLVGDTELTCGFDGSWDKPIPKCVPITCEDPGAPENGGRMTDSYAINSEVTYSCHNGFMMVGQAVATCLAGGKYSSPKPTCELINCGNPGRPRNGRTIAPTTTFASLARFTCNMGYSLIGEQSAVCQGDGSWSSEPPVCRLVDCRDPGRPRNGRRTVSSTTFGSRANFECQFGFILNGNEERICLGSGEWSGAVPVCIPIDCGQPGMVANLKEVRSVGGTSYPDARVTYGPCNDGFVLRGDRVITCLASGRWSAPPPTCEPINCGDVAAPLNGDRHRLTTSLNAQVTYQCHTGYVLQGARFRNCQTNGQWSEQQPRCVAVDCGDPGVPGNGRVTAFDTPVGRSPYSYLGKVTFACNDGYRLLGAATRQCTACGQWDQPMPLCVPMECPDLSGVKDGDIDMANSTTYSRAQFQCDPGFSLNGERSLQCGTDSLWSSNSPLCEPNECAPLEIPLNGVVIAPSNFFGDVATIACDAGYKLQGSETRTCEADMEWSGVKAICDLVTCGRPPDVANARISGNIFTYGAEVEYRCNLGFTLMGSNVRECTAGGTWSGQSPVCVEIMCPNPGSIANGVRTPDGISFSYGATVRYSCNTGFGLVGTEVRRCDGTGIWSADAPECVALLCNDPGVPKDGSRLLTTLQIGATVSYSCNSGYTLKGASTADCQATSTNGVWSNPLPTCEIVDCGDPGKPEDGVSSFTSTTYGSSVTHVCTRGFKLIGRSSRICLANGRWSGFLPECAEINCGDPGFPMNGARSGDRFTFEQTVSYTCNPGFEMQGAMSQRCQRSEQWSEHRPYCAPLTCANPGEPANGERVGDDFSFGASISYRCNNGYRLVGELTRTCTAEGVFTGTSPSCIPLECQEPAVPVNGDRLLNTLTLGSSVNFTCNTGFTMIGEASITCTVASSGTVGWSNPPPTCQAVTCGDPEFGQVQWDGTRTSYSMWRNFLCPPGSVLTGSTSRRCTEDGTFSGRPASCTPENCGVLTAPVGGTINVDRTTFGGTATFTCNPGFSLVGSERRVCSAGGVWSGSQPFCIRIRCDHPGRPAYSSQVTTANDNDFTPADSITFSCDPGFFLSGEATISCGIDGSWSHQTPSCVAHMCPVPTALDNGDIQMSSRFAGARVTYSCDVGFSLSGSSTRRCEVNAQGSAAAWTLLKPTCDPIICDVPNPIENGQFASLSNDNGYRYTCNIGYRLVGASVRFCHSDGSLSGESPTCEIVDCGRPSSIVDGTARVTTTVYGSTATYRCNTGFQLSGSAVRRCQADGFWSGSAVSCVAIDCGNPGAPADGSRLSNTYTFGSQVSFDCDDGFQLVGQRTMICLASGSWSSSVPRCSILDCGNPGTLDNGGRSYSASTVGNTVSYYCNVGYQLIGEESRECLANGDNSAAAWSGTMPVCRIVDCGEPGELLRGSRTGNVFTYNSLVSFACVEGYAIRGSVTRRCQANGLWSGTQPSCVIVDCGQPETIQNGGALRFTSTLYQSTVSYVCNSGYSLVGEAVRTCEANGHWSGAAPQCVIVSCPNPGKPVDGSRTGDDFTFGSSVSFTCSSGFRLDGSATARCLVSRMWSSNTPTCIRLDCRDPGTPANGDRALSHTLVGATVNYTCNIGYLLRGVQMRTCETTRDGRSAAWSSTLPLCNIVDCGRVSAPANGHMTGSVFTYDATVSFSCNTGYALSGSEYRTCQASGLFSGTAAACVVVDCGDPGTPQNGGREGELTTYNNEFTFTCDTGYILFGSSQRTCTASSGWSGSQPTCQIVDCGDPGTPSNGDRSGRLTTFLNTYTFTCNNGYRLTGAMRRDCQASGQWSGVVTQCIAIRCDDPGTPLNGGRDGESFTLSSEVSYFCNPGYALSGDVIRTCRANGQFDGSLPSCQLISCGDPGIPEDGSRDGDNFNYNSQVSFACNTGFRLINSRERFCEASGQWSGIQPVCIRIDCGSLVAPANGQVVVTDTFYEGRASYTCQQGYELQGNEIRTCRVDELWSGSMPECKIVECCALEAPANGGISVSSFTYSSTAEFTCNTNYNLVGSQRRICQADGSWSGLAARCEAVLCIDPGTPVNGRKVSFSYAVGGEIEYECKEGYRLVGQQTITCQADRTWSHPVPICQIINCGDPGSIQHGQKSSSTFNYGETIEYRCDRSFTRNGPYNITCQINGQWTPPPPTCDPDCLVNPWGEWGICSTTCGDGVRTRSRLVLQQNAGIGRECPHLIEREPCFERPCVLCDGRFPEGHISYSISSQQRDVATDIIIVVDESASMEGEHAWLPSMIEGLEDALVEENIGSSSALRNMYSLIGFGQRDTNRTYLYPHKYNNTRDYLFPATDFSIANRQLYADPNGRTEDGYAAIKYAFDEIPLRTDNSDVVYNVIFISDEDRDTLPGAENYTRPFMKRFMRNVHDKGSLLNVVVDQQFTCGRNGPRALGVDHKRVGYQADGAGGSRECADGRLGIFYEGTRRDYTTLALELGGAAWDINLLRVVGPISQSFTKAFVKVKTAEIRRTIDLCRRCVCRDDGREGTTRCLPAAQQEECKCNASNGRYVNGECIAAK